MRLDNQRRSTNFEDRGRGSASGGGGGALGVRLLFTLVRVLGVKGTLVVGGIVGVLAIINPFGIRTAVARAFLGDTATDVPRGGRVCDTYGPACDFSARVLGATEEVWAEEFRLGKLPPTGAALPRTYQEPTLVVFSGSVQSGCGRASSSMGPFYCQLDRKLYIDPSFYDVMAKKLRAPGDFAQAYVIAHEVGHHVQNLIGASRKSLPGESENQTSVRVELQADCLAGVWGHQKRVALAVDGADLKEALDAAHAIGDDALGHSNARNFTHGSSEQRMRWFRRGFDSGDARLCDTFAVGAL